MSRASRRPRFGLHLTSGLVVDRRLSAAAKLRAGVSAYLAGHDPSLRALESFLPFEAKTLSAAARDLESLGLARIVRPQRPRDRLIVQPAGLALPGRHGRHRFATIGPDLAHAAFTAASGRSATAYAALVVQRLLREQLKRGAAHIAPDVVAADVGISVKLALALLDDLERGGVIERHRSHAADSDGLRIYSIPLGEELYPVNPDGLDEDQSRISERVAIEGHELTVIGRRRDLAAVPLRLSELRQALPAQAIEAAIAAAASGNISGSAFLVGDLLDVLSPAATATWPRYDGDLAPLRRRLSPALLKQQASSSKQNRYADQQDKDRAASLDAGRASPPENLSGDEVAGQSSAASTTRPGTHTYQAPYHPSVSYAARPETHERIAALLDVVARRYGDGEAGGAAYLAVEAATEEWMRGATGSAVLAALSRRFGYLAERDEPPASELDFGRIGEAAA